MCKIACQLQYGKNARIWGYEGYLHHPLYVMEFKNYGFDLVFLYILCFNERKIIESYVE